MEWAKRTGAVERHPGLDPLDEYPLVPFLIEDDRRVHYDSSALARWIDVRHPGSDGPLVPTDPALAFAAQLVDEAFDEFGLYMVHHNRWVVSAATNDAGERLATELRSFVPRTLRARVAARFSARQVRRLPYLFSVAPAEPDRYDLAPSRRPPGRIGFPPNPGLGGSLDAGRRKSSGSMDSAASAPVPGISPLQRRMRARGPGWRFALGHSRNGPPEPRPASVHDTLGGRCCRLCPPARKARVRRAMRGERRG